MKSDFINCKNCTDDCRCKGKDITPICISFKPAKTTNADKIRSMNDEELADFITDDMCGLICGDQLECEGQCKQKMLDWLKEEEKG